MNRIIVPTDFSDVSWNATVHALAYCRMFDAELLLVHVYSGSSNGLDTNFATLSDSMSDEDERMKTLLSEIKSLTSFNNVVVKTKCLGGTIYRNVAGLLNDSGGDLVIMGSRNRTGAFGMLFGSNANRLIRELDCQILLIPIGFKFSLSTPTTCALDHGTIIKETDLKLLERLVQITSRSVFKIIHVINHHKSDCKELLLDQFKNLKITCDEVVGANVSELLEKYSLETNSGLMVLVKKEKGFFERLFHVSVVDQMTSNANVPLLILRSEPE